jgi:GNAT superfamily N-acetyltransferase
MIKIRAMTIHDLQLGLRLTQQAGWNQTESDWLRFINLEPTGCFVAELNESAAGTTTTCILGQVAWIAMVLVDVNSRGQGVGTRLLEHSLGYLNQRKVKTVRLDATPAGQPIYAKLGFEPEYELARFEGIAPQQRRRPEPIRLTLRVNSVEGPEPAAAKVTPEIYADIIEFDNRMTGTDRTKMLTRLFEEFPQNIRFLSHGDKIDGFATIRTGANAVQIGPCIATMKAGPPLLRDALARCAGKPVFVDIPLHNAAAVKIAESSGLRVQRRFMRMYRGEKIRDNIKALWTSSGPEKG